jgi:hypothetical protein
MAGTCNKFKKATDAAFLQLISEVHNTQPFTTLKLYMLSGIFIYVENFHTLYSDL